MLEDIRGLYAYSAWANGRVLATAEGLPAEQLLTAEDGIDSIRDTLVHIASAQATWLARWQGETRPMPWEAAAFPDVASLRVRWQEVERSTARYVDGLQAADLERIVRYVNYQGETWAYPLWQQLLHQVNHATQHRSEAALLLTRYGHSPGPLDFLVYFDLREQGALEAALA